MLQQPNQLIYQLHIRWLQLGEFISFFFIFFRYIYYLLYYDCSRALPPPPAHHSSARPVLASHHAAHPLPAHLQFPSHAQVAAAASYGFAPLSPAKTHHQYQPTNLWFAE